MKVSAIGGPAASQYADALRASLAAKASAKSAAPVDSDGDHDGSTSATGRLDVKA